MELPPLSLLLVEDDDGDARLFMEVLSTEPTTIQVHRSRRLSEGIEAVAHHEFHVLLVDLSLPDSAGLDCVVRMRAAAPETPIVVLTSLDDEETALAALRKGAQDYLVKGGLAGSPLMKTLRYAIERQRMQVELRELAIRDPLTGLHNRRGFLVLAEEQLKLARRSGKGFFVFYLDLNDMKGINDRHGHAAGDQALMDTAEVLRRTFRDSDILARLGGDEFSALAIEASLGSEALLMARLEDQVQAINGHPGRSHALSLTVGMARFDAESKSPIEDLLTLADQDLYRQKKARAARQPDGIARDIDLRPRAHD